MKSLRRYLNCLAALAIAAASLTACSSGGSDEPDNPVDPSKPDTTKTTDVLETAKAGRVVIAYAPYYRENRLPNPKIVTNINYAFAEVFVNGNTYTKFEVHNRQLFDKIRALKSQNSQLKISLSFTHSTEVDGHVNEGGFSKLVASEANRKKFAQDCLKFCQTEGIDGIDLDWEFPGLRYSSAAPAIDTKNDVANFTLLVKQLRETLGDRYLLTFAGYVMDKRQTDDGGWKYIDLAAVQPYVDFVNLMTYDMDAAFDGGQGKFNFTSGGYQSGITSAKSYWDIMRTIREYQAAGFPMSKMVLGIPFYVRVSFDGNPLSIYDYNQLATLGAGFSIDNWDSESNTPFVTYNGKFYGSYDNAESISIKGRKFIGGYQMKGMLYWESGEDDARYTLSKAVWNAVMKSY